MPNSKKTIVGNWKMYTSTLAEAHELTKKIAAHAASAEVVICPPTPFIAGIAWLVKGAIGIGAQDVAKEGEGAHTGNVSARMLKEVGAGYVIIGHSERRQRGEKSEEVRAKAVAAIAQGLIPIICIGETEVQRDQGRAEAVIKEQLAQSVPPEAEKSQIIIAYEPVWAIGSGKTPTGDDIRKMHAYIIDALATQLGLAPGLIHVLYGGSVKAANAREIMAIAGVAGVLVGGASVKADEFLAVIDSAK